MRAFAQQDSGPQKPASPQQQQQATITVQAPAVNIDAVVTDQDGNILTGLKKENFRVYDENKEQQITNFAPTDAPITIVIVMEFSSRFYGIFAQYGTYWSDEFLGHLGQKDWVALVTYDLKTTIRTDFTQNKMEVRDAIRQLFFPDFHEANMFDALLETVDRLKDVQGKKSILLMSTGYDTFSKHTYDQTLKAMKQTDVTIFAVSTGEAIAVRTGADADIGYLQAQNQLNSLTKLTGGYAWFPRFDGELPSIFNSVTAFLRNQYTIGFTPTNYATDGKFHKLRVEVVDDAGNPLMTTNKKGKKQKIVVYAREGYLTPKGSVGD